MLILHVSMHAALIRKLYRPLQYWDYWPSTAVLKW